MNLFGKHRIFSWRYRAAAIRKISDSWSTSFNSEHNRLGQSDVTRIRVEWRQRVSAIKRRCARATNWTFFLKGISKVFRLGSPIDGRYVSDRGARRSSKASRGHPHPQKDRLLMLRVAHHDDLQRGTIAGCSSQTQPICNGGCGIAASRCVPLFNPINNPSLSHPERFPTKDERGRAQRNITRCQSLCYGVGAVGKETFACSFWAIKRRSRDPGE